MAGERAAGRVIAEVEVACFNFIGNSFFLIGLAEGEGGLLEMPRGWLLPGEDPAQAATRILETVTGISTGVHEPAFVGVFVHPNREVDCLTLSYTVLVTTPSDLHWEWRHKVETRGSPHRLRPRIQWGDSAVAARFKIRDVVSELPVATRIASEVAKNRDGLFRLIDLQTVYERVLGCRIDTANFRRKVEAVPGFVEEVTFEEVMESSRPPAVTRGRRPTWYRAGPAERLEPPIRFEVK